MIVIRDKIYFLFSSSSGYKAPTQRADVDDNEPFVKRHSLSLGRVPRLEHLCSEGHANGTVHGPSSLLPAMAHMHTHVHTYMYISTYAYMTHMDTHTFTQGAYHKGAHVHTGTCTCTAKCTCTHLQNRHVYECMYAQNTKHT